MFLQVLVNLASAMLKDPLTRLAIPLVGVLANRDTWARNVIAIARLKIHYVACQIVLVFADKVGLVTNAKMCVRTHGGVESFVIPLFFLGCTYAVVFFVAL